MLETRAVSFDESPGVTFAQIYLVLGYVTGPVTLLSGAARWRGDHLEVDAIPVS